MKKLLRFLNSRVLFFLALVFTVVIPLLPKLPLFDIVQTWVYIRFEDFLVLVTALILIVRFVSGQKKEFRSPITLPIILYLLVGGVSLVVALIFIFPSFSGVLFPHLAILHYLRRIEYLVPFFLGLSAFSGKPHRLKYFLGTLTVVSLLVVFYGLGQKLWGFPAFLTMNEEFAKGVPLRLPPTARIPSTFGGHYDLAAFLVLVIPVFGAMALSVRRRLVSVFLAATAVALYVLLLLTASRVSFGVYLVAITVMLVWLRKKILIIPVVLLSFFLLNYVSVATERFYKTLRFSDVIVDATTGRPVGTLEMLEGGTAVVKSQEQPDEESLPHGSEFISAGTGNQKEVETIRFTRTDLLSSGGGEISTVSGSFLIQKAFVYDISITTRFQGQWPKAMAAFQRNVLLGSGYSSLSVASDGDYLRMLGETGIIGAIFFLGIFAYFLYWFTKVKNSLGGVERGFVVGLSAGLVGLLVNAVLIDVFEASKVAFTLYLLLGVAAAVMSRYGKPELPYFQFLKRVLTSRRAQALYLVVGAFALYHRAIGMYFVADDFTWLRWAKSEDIRSVWTNFVDAKGFFYRPVPKLLYFLEYSFFWLKPAGYHIVSIVLFALSAVLTMVLLRLFQVGRILAIFLALWYLSLSVHHENVIWISGQSSLLAAVLFLAAAIAAIFAFGKRQVRRLWETAAYLLCLLSMMSYDGMVLTPAALILILAVFKNGFRRRFWPYLILIPLYYLIRTLSGAVPPAGDYAVNLAKLPFNVAGNAVAYLAAIFAGVPAIEQFTVLRAFFRANPLPLVFVLGFGFIAAIRFRKKLFISPAAAYLLLAPFVAMGPYLGLGNAAERYALTGSAILTVALGVMIEKTTSLRRFWVREILLVLLIVSLVFNIRTLASVHGDWEKAADIVENTLLSVRKEFFPLFSNTEFAFINAPIRYGRAWVFPTGLYDPLWHMFYINNYWFDTFSYSSLEEALKHDGSRTGVFWFALEFDRDYRLYRTRFDVSTIRPEEVQ